MSKDKLPNDQKAGSTDRKPQRNVTLAELQLADIATITGQIDRLGKSLVEAMSQRDELLEALKTLVEILPEDFVENWPTCVAVARAAIKRATGQAGREVTRAEGPSN